MFGPLIQKGFKRRRSLLRVFGGCEGGYGVVHDGTAAAAAPTEERAGLAAFRSGMMAVMAVVVLGVAADAAQPRRTAPPEPQSFDGQAWRRVPVRPGGEEALAQPSPPMAGRNRCITTNNIAGAQLYGDRIIELTMRGGKRWRLHLAQLCPGLSFYQGFYYQQKQAGQLCASRDSIGARSGGECAIASIMPVPATTKARPARKARRRR